MPLFQKRSALYQGIISSKLLRRYITAIYFDLSFDKMN